MKKNNRILIFLIIVLLISCRLSPQISPTDLIQEYNTPINPSTISPAFTKTPRPTTTPSPTPATTSTPLPTKEVLLQYGDFGGDGWWYTDYFLGRDTPNLILFTDGQIIISKRDDAGIWFEETFLTGVQICSLLSQIEAIGFFDIEGDGARFIEDPIYKFNEPVEVIMGAPSMVIEVNGNRHKTVHINGAYLSYVIPEIRNTLNLLQDYIPPQPLSTYKPQYMLLWIEKGMGDASYLTPAPSHFIWSEALPAISELEKIIVDTGYGLEEYYGDSANVSLLTGDILGMVFNEFDNRINFRLYDTEDGEYYLIPRPLLPHENILNISPHPETAHPINIPFSCKN